MVTSETGDMGVDDPAMVPFSASPGGPVPSGSGDLLYDGSETEVARLERLLRERASEVRELRARVAAEGRLLRELSRRLSEMPGAQAMPGQQGQADALRSAVARAVEAEAGRAELAFRLDEAQGVLVELRARDLDQVALSEAKFAGTARGLRAALSEVEEARDVAQARLLLAEDDLEGARGLVTTLERQLAETEEEVELLRLRASGRDELVELRQRLIEAQQQLETVAAERDGERIRGDGAREEAEEARRTQLAELAELRAAIAQEQLVTRAAQAQLELARQAFAERASAAQERASAAQDGVEQAPDAPSETADPFAATPSVTTALAESEAARHAAEQAATVANAEVHALSAQNRELEVARNSAADAVAAASAEARASAEANAVLRADLADMRVALGAREAAMVATEQALQQATADECGVGSLIDTLRVLREELRALLAVQDTRNEQPNATATMTGASSPASEAPSAAVLTPGDDTKLADRLARSEGHVRTLQGELGRERDLRSEERKRTDRELAELSMQCDELRTEAAGRAAKLHETARRARALLSLVPVGEPLAAQIGELLETIDG